LGSRRERAPASLESCVSVLIAVLPVRIAEDLTPASPEDVRIALALALTRGDRRRRYQSAETMARIVAERLLAELSAAGFVIMRKPIDHGGHVAKGRPLDERGDRWKPPEV
jgi:hypothetical protein